MPPDDLTGNTARRRISRVIFGTDPHIFTLDELSTKYLAMFGLGMDVESAKQLLSELATAGYIRVEGDCYGVVMLPMEPVN